MDLYTDRPVTPLEEWAEETRNVEVPGTADRDGQPIVVQIRRLPAAEIYLTEGTKDLEQLRQVYRRWAELAIVAPKFSFNGTADSGPLWDDLPFIAHEGLATKIMKFSFETSAAAAAVEAAFRGGEPAGGDDGGTGGGPGGAGADAPGEPAPPAAGPEPEPDGGA